ncbi:MAG: hypothetical protein WCJ57_02405 [Candidatus Falkowbacteria bacterium]
MKKAVKYPLDNNISGGRGKFHKDIYVSAFNCQVPVATILRDFFRDNPSLSDKEKGNYALYATFKGSVAEACAILVYALEITPDQAGQRDILAEYFSCWDDSIFKPMAMEIDNLLNWPSGTIRSSVKSNLVMWSKEK